MFDSTSSEAKTSAYSELLCEMQDVFIQQILVNIAVGFFGIKRAIYSHQPGNVCHEQWVFLGFSIVIAYNILLHLLQHIHTF